MRSPFLICHDNTFNNLDARKSTSPTSGLQLFQDRSVELAVMYKGTKIPSSNTILSREFLQSRFGGIDDGDRLGLIRSGVDADIGYHRSGSIERLKLGRSLAYEINNEEGMGERAIVWSLK